MNAQNWTIPYYLQDVDPQYLYDDNEYYGMVRETPEPMESQYRQDNIYQKELLAFVLGVILHFLTINHHVLIPHIQQAHK